MRWPFRAAMTSGVMAFARVRRHHEDLDNSSQHKEVLMTDIGAIAIACGLIIGLGAIGA